MESPAMYGRPRAGVYMKNFIRRLFGRFHVVTHSDVLSYKGSWRTARDPGSPGPWPRALGQFGLGQVTP